MRWLLYIASAFVPGMTLASTWYVRPGVFDDYGVSYPNPRAGVYGSQDGTSYANAWNGVTSIVWGGAGVNTGDTIYICGLHIYSVTNGEPTSAFVTTMTVPGVTIRMDYPTEGGLLFGGRTDRRSSSITFDGPDGNGVYRHACAAIQSRVLYYIDGTNIIRLPETGLDTWALSTAGQHWNGATTNFLKLPGGVVPVGTNTALEINGWTIDLNRQSNTIFYACNFNGIASFNYWGTGLKWTTPDYGGGFIGEKWITFRNCTLTNWQGFSLYPGHDYWTFDGCEMGNCPYGIYTEIRSQVRGPDGLTVVNSHIHDCNTVDYPNVDGHAVGIQGGNNHVIFNNRTERTGSAIVLWAGSVEMTNSLIASNVVSDAASAGAGISISAATASSSTGHRVFNNVVVNCGVTNTVPDAGYGIGTSSRDAVQIFNNTVSNCYYGIWLSQGADPVAGYVTNNIVIDPIYRYIHNYGTGWGDFGIGHNLYHPATDTSSGFYQSAGGPGYGDGNVFGDPLLTVDYHLTAASPAVNAGTNVGLPFYGTAPDIGAFEFGAGLAHITTLRAGSIHTP